MSKTRKEPRFTERDINVNDVFSRSGKATGNMYLTLAKHKKQKKEEEQPVASRFNPLRDRRSKIKNTKTIVTYCLHLTIFSYLDS